MAVRLNQMKSNLLLDCEGQFSHFLSLASDYSISQSINRFVSFRLNNKQSVQHNRTSITRRKTIPSNQTSEWDAIKSGLLCCKWKVSVPAPLTVCVASCCVDSLLTCDPWGRQTRPDRRQLRRRTGAAPPASLSPQSMTVSVHSGSPFLHFLSQCSCTSAVSSSAPPAHLPHGCSFLLF